MPRSTSKTNNVVMKTLMSLSDILMMRKREVLDRFPNKPITNSVARYAVEKTFDKCAVIAEFYPDVRKGRWMMFDDVTPGDYCLDWTVVQFVEVDTGYHCPPYIASFVNGRWKTRPDNIENDIYLNECCNALSWKVCDVSPEFYAQSNQN